MAIYRLCMRIIKRSAGQSAVACAAYRAGETLHDERADKTHDYSKKADVVHSEILAPEHAGEWVQDRGALWNAIEKAERQYNSQLAREVQIALPRELSRAQQVQLVRSFVQEEFVSKGMIADVCLHENKASDGGTNPHAHIMLTMRELTPEGDKFERAKNRQWNRDYIDGGTLYDNENGEKLGGFNNRAAARFGSVNANRVGLVGLRARWDLAANQALEDSGSTARIDHRSYADRGIDREAQPKLGAAQKMQKRDGTIGDQVRKYHRVKDRNATRWALERMQRGESLGDSLIVIKAEERKARAKQKALDQGRSYGGRMNPRCKSKTLDDMNQEIYGDLDR